MPRAQPRHPPRRKRGTPAHRTPNVTAGAIDRAPNDGARRLLEETRVRDGLAAQLRRAGHRADAAPGDGPPRLRTTAPRRAREAALSRTLEALGYHAHDAWADHAHLIADPDPSGVAKT